MRGGRSESSSPVARRPVGPTTLLLLCCALVGSCGGNHHPSRVLAEPTIKVLDAGAEPREHLRYDFRAHSPERMELTFKLRVNSAYTNTVLETGHRSADFPTIKATARVEVSALNADGTATVSSIVDEVAVVDDFVDPAIHAIVDVEVKAMKGSQSSWRISPSGRISHATASAPNASAEVRAHLANVADTMRENAVIFPEQVVGVGASWQVTSQYLLFGVAWERTTTYSLKALSDTSATVEEQTSMRADSQALRVEPRATTRLTSASSNATAELVVRRHNLVASATSHGTSEMNLLIVRGNLRLVSSVQTEAISSVRPIPETQP